VVLLSHCMQLLRYCLQIGLNFVSDILRVSTVRVPARAKNAGYQKMLVSGDSYGNCQYWHEKIVFCLRMYLKRIVFLLKL
jgi:hypothetical protein